MGSSAALFAHAHRALGNIDVVEHDYKVLYIGLVLVYKLFYGNARKIHVSKRLCDNYFFAAAIPRRNKRVALARFEFKPQFVRKTLRGKKTHIVESVSVFVAVVSQPNDYFHYFASLNSLRRLSISSTETP